MTPTFILVHGGSHGGACWDQVVGHLTARRYRALAPDLPGMGNDPTPLREITMARWAGFIADMARSETGPVVLVGHSRGGSVISEAAELAPEAVSGLIYVSAILMPGGSKPAEEVGGANPELMQALTPDPENIATTIDPEAARGLFYHRAASEDQERALAQLCPEPIQPNLAALTVTAERWGRVPRAYVECTDDRALPLDYQRAMQAKLPCDPVVTMDSDHSPFLCKAEELCGHLIGIGETFANEDHPYAGTMMSAADQ